jgi:hypothetical protein
MTAFIERVLQRLDYDYLASQMDRIREEWLSHLLSTEAADRSRAESALCDLYAAAGFPPPMYFFWCDSPFRATLAMLLLSSSADLLKRRMVAALERIARERKLLDEVRTQLCRAAAQPEWSALLSVTGGESLLPPFGATKSPYAEVFVSRLRLHKTTLDAVSHFNDQDPLQRAETHLSEVMSGQRRWGAINPLVNSSFYRHYTFSMMAFDEIAADGKTPPPAVAAAWRVARAAGCWWPFANAVVLSERPTELHLNADFVPHRGGGAAALFRDGTTLWAWNGRPMREEWIMQPETISARDLKYFDGAFRDYAAARSPAGKPAKARPKPSTLLKKELPRGTEERISALREHNKGLLPLFDRYVAGEYEKVWEELVRLGRSVREDPHAADALAVAYETMRRVNANVRSITERLQTIEYRFISTPHQQPHKRVFRQVTKLEKAVGALPLSLRAFYEIVGAVDWTGEHPGLAPRGDSVAPDPLVVYGADDALAQIDSGWFMDDDPAIVIAPDDLHKSNTSGGAPYQIGVPDLNADGKLLNENHEQYFVEYLRTVFRFGGFPGYHGIVGAPPELEALKQGLLPF